MDRWIFSRLSNPIFHNKYDILVINVEDNKRSRDFYILYDENSVRFLA